MLGRISESFKFEKLRLSRILYLPLPQMCRPRKFAVAANSPLPQICRHRKLAVTSNLPLPQICRGRSFWPPEHSVEKMVFMVRPRPDNSMKTVRSGWSLPIEVQALRGCHVKKTFAWNRPDLPGSGLLDFWSGGRPSKETTSPIFSTISPNVKIRKKCLFLGNL